MSPDRQLAKQLASLGYGSRKDMEAAIRTGRVSRDGEDIFVDGEPVDPPQGMVLMMHKPAGFTCSRQDQGPLVYDLLPPRYLRRSPALSTVGRLDADTSGLLLFTDDGQLLHRLISPKSETPKVYEAKLARPLEGHETDLFASGTLMLRDETKPLKPAQLEVTGERTVRITLTEGRYHQVRRMFAAAGNHVDALHRSAFGPLTLGTLAEGNWRQLTDDEFGLI